MLYLLFAVLQYFIVLCGAQSGALFMEQEESSCRSVSFSGNDPCGFASLGSNRTFYQPNTTLLPNFEHIKILQLISKSNERNTDCSTHIVSLLCNYLYPPCTSDDEPRPLCNETCNRLTQELCHEEWKQLLSTAMESTLLRPLVNNMDCRHNYYPNNHNYTTNASMCWDADTNVRIAMTNLDYNQFTIILSFIFGFEVFLLLVSIGITVIVVRKLRRWKVMIDKTNNKDSNIPGHRTIHHRIENGTLRNVVLLGSLMNQNKKIQGQRMLLENVPLPYMDIMSQYVDYLLQEDKLQLIKFLADGASTEVYQGSYSESQSHGTSISHFVAVKRFKEPINDEMVLKYIRHCLELTSVDHPNVLKLKGLSFGTRHRLLMVSPYFSQHNLLTYLRMFRMQETSENKQVANPVKHLISIILQISSGMKALADMDITYKMLSSETCLVDSEGNVFIGDLSYSWFVNQAVSCTVWNAPEVRSGSSAQYSEKSDVWSFAVTSLEVLNMGGLPASSSTATTDDNKDWLQKPTICPQLLYDLLLSCLDSDPQKRPNFSTIVSEINTLMSTESFTTELLTTSLSEGANTTALLYGPYGYLRILPDSQHIEQDYQYTLSMHNLRQPPLTEEPVTSPPHPPVISIDTISLQSNSRESDDGYVDVSPQLSSSFKLEPVIGFNSPPSPHGFPSSRSSPVPQFSERPDSEDEEEDESREYYNLHFKPIKNSNKNHKNSRKTRNN